MEGARFDSLTHALISSRRGNVKALLGGVLGMLLASRAGEQAMAGCKKEGKKCDKNKDCCDGATCKGKKCRCKSGLNECGGKCFDFDKDEQHCGSCTTACAAGESCVAGVCAEGGCTADRDSCAPSAICTSCPDRADAVCYLDDAGKARCALTIFCFDCDDDAFCEDLFGPGARCVGCAGQCGGSASGRACAAD